MPENYYPVVQRWADASDDERNPFKNFVRALVGYECKVACITNDGWVDIYVLSVDSGEVSDWLEVQPSGAVGVVFNSYPDPQCAAVMRLSDKCDDYNDSLAISFEDESDEEEEDSE
jgi:hypothetical protein